MNRSRRRIPAARPLLAALLVLALTACGSSGSGDSGNRGAPATQPSTAPVDSAVKVVGLPEGTEASVKDTAAAGGDGENLTFVSPLYTLAPGGALESPVTVRLELDNALPTDATVLVATRDTDQQPYKFVRAYLTTDQQHVQFTTRTLNQVGAVSVDVPSALESLQTDVRSGLAAGVVASVRRPACQGAGEARKDGYSIAASPKKTLFACFGVEGGKRVVKLTNRRRVPVQVSHPGAATVSNPRVAAWRSWSGPLGLANTFLPPGQSVTYDADLQPRSRLVLTSTSTPTAQSLRLLQATVRALVLRLTAFGTEAPTAASAFAAMLAIPSCRRSLERGGAALLTECLGQSQVARLFPASQLLVAPLVTNRAFGSFLRSQAAAVADQVRSQELQRVVVRRAAPKFESFMGSWTGAGRSLSVSAPGVVTEAVYNQAQLVVQLTYQLADPTTKGTASSAKATITRVKVGDRKLLNGRVPQVRDTGVLRIDAGVVTPPFLKTNYCSAAKRKTCS
ncbi:MAG: hypothetical protein ABIQ92_11165 [Ornithinibacter sp.]